MNDNIQGVTGAVYAPMDTSPQATAVNQAMSLIQEGLAQLTTLITSLDKRIGENPPQNVDLQATVDLVLQQSTWFDNKVAEFLKTKDDLIENVIEDVVRDRMDQAVVDWFINEFRLSDHVDIDDLIKEVVETNLRRATITVDL